MTVSEVYSTVKHFSAGLVMKDLIPEVEGEGSKWRFLGIQSKNRAEWNISHMGNYFAGGTTVAFFDTLGPDASRFICNETELTTMCASNDLIGNIIKLKADDPNNEMSRVVNIVAFDGAPSQADKDAAQAVGITIYTFDEIVAAGKEKQDYQPYNADPEDIYMFSYTSGTTGNPKGVKLSHKMIMQCAHATNFKLFDKKFTNEDVYISYLPAAHSFE
jgi:long-chain acyl-CoA synthetase